MASFIAAISLVLGVGLGTAAYAIADPAGTPPLRPSLRTVDWHRPGGIGPAWAAAEMEAALAVARDRVATIEAQERLLERFGTAGGNDDLEHEAAFERARQAALPPAPEASGEGRRVIYSNSAQRVWLIDAEEAVIASYLVSGRRGTPRPGTYEVFSKSEVAWADHDGITMRFMVRFARGEELAIGFHSIPVYPGGRPLQTERDLGNFRSAGCVRQSLLDARRLWAFAPVGTTVVVTP